MHAARSSISPVLGLWCWLLFACQFVLIDLWVRGLGTYGRQPKLLAGLAASWALLTLIVRLAAAQRPWVKGFAAIIAGGLMLAVLAYFRYYHAPLDAQAVLAARHAWSDVYPVLWRGAPELCVAGLGLMGVEFALLCHARASKLSRSGLVVAVIVGSLITGSLAASTSEFRSLEALWILCTTRDHKPVDQRLPLPEFESTRGVLPNVLFIISESLRASDACQNRGCPTGPELDRLLPNRVTFEQARSLSSYTAIALSALATGQLQVTARRELAKAPDFFDLAHAVRAGASRYSLVYWSSQLASVFERGPITQVTDQVVTAETLLHGPAADIEDAVAALLDRNLADHCEQNLPQLASPRFVILHLSGTHAPYAFDDESAPYKPWRRQVTWSGLADLHRAYLNSIVEQDRNVGRCLGSFLKLVQNQPWVVIYTSDHGEAFGEHSAIHHGQNLYDEQLRVPFILAHGGGALTPNQAATLELNARSPVTHLDLLPTLLDVWGLNYHVALRGWSSKLAGRDLLLPIGELGQLPITNCTELFPCPINTWGVLGERTKLMAQTWDGQWRCLSLSGSEREVDLSACSPLRTAACRHFKQLPNLRIDPECHR